MFAESEFLHIIRLPSQEKLRVLFKNYGCEVFLDSRRLVAIITDFFSDEIGLKCRLINAIHSRIHLLILNESDKRISQVRLQQLIMMTMDRTGMSKESAEEIVLLFAYATGKIKDFSLNKVYYPSLHPVRINGLYGYADGNNTVVIAPKYDQAKPFSCDRAKVCRKGRFGYIDRSGEEVIDLIFEKALDFCDGQAKVVLDGESMLIDPDGKTIGGEV